MARVVAGQSEDTEFREATVGPSDQHLEVGSWRKDWCTRGDHKGEFHPLHKISSTLSPSISGANRKAIRPSGNKLTSNPLTGEVALQAMLLHMSTYWSFLL